MAVRTTFYFSNGNVAVCDENGRQILELQGRFEDVWQKVWDAADDETEFNGWPQYGPDSRIKRSLHPAHWESYFALCRARSKGLILAMMQGVENACVGQEYLPKLGAMTDVLANLANFHDQANKLGLTGADIMTEWSEIARLAVEGTEKIKQEHEAQS